VESVGDKIRIGAIAIADEGFPFPGVTVSFVDRKGISHSAITDADGRFQILLDRESWVPTIEVKLELMGFKTQTMSIDLPYPPPPTPKPEEPPPTPPCDIQEVVLKNGKGIAFSNGKIIHNIEEESYDIYFKNEKFYVKKKKGGIATLGDQGNISLCEINYPAYGYCDCIKIIENHVYLYESYTDNILSEIRVKSFEKSKEVKISYHVRME